MTRTTTAAVALTTAALALTGAATASAHVTIQPDEAPAGSYAVVDVRVPNEKDDRGTVKVELQLPPGVSYAATQPVPDWTARVERRRPTRPFSVDGTAQTSEVDTITWTGRGRAGVVAPGQFQQFPVSLRLPDGAEGTAVQFKALQTYEGGEVVRWIGAKDAELPAPTVTLDEAEPEHGGHQSAASTDTEETAVAADAGATDDTDEDGGETLPIVLGAAGLLAGLAGLGLAVAGRRRRA